MMSEIEKIIQNENKKNPLTDEEIAEILKISREDVTRYRLLNNISNSNERRKSYLYDDIKKFLRKTRIYLIESLPKV